MGYTDIMKKVSVTLNIVSCAVFSSMYHKHFYVLRNIFSLNLNSQKPDYALYLIPIQKYMTKFYRPTTPDDIERYLYSIYKFNFVGLDKYLIFIVHLQITKC